MDSFSEVEDIYPLSPMQKGMLFHLLYQPGSRAYFNQIAFTLDADLDRGAFEQSVGRLAERHPVLRTSLHWEDIQKPVQVVHRRAAPGVEWLDVSALDASSQKMKIDQSMRADRSRGFELGQAPLERFTVLRLSSTSSRVVFSYLHLLLEGGSAVHCLLELFQLYDGLRAGVAVALPPQRPFRDYIAWLQRQDPEGGIPYWRHSLRGIMAPTPLAPFEKIIERKPAATDHFREHATRLSLAFSERLRQMARKHHFTLNTLFQAAWALQLSRYAGSDEVVFGATVAGRSAPIDGIESMVGLFINTLPVIVKVPPAQSVVSWMLGIQGAQAEARQHEHTPLVQILAASQVPRGLPLFETNVVFESMPLHRNDSPGPEALAPRDVLQADEQTYALNLVIEPAPQIGMLLVYDTDRFSGEDAARRLRHLEVLLEGLEANPAGPVGRVPMLTGQECKLVLEDQNQTRETVPGTLLVHELFEAQAARTPEAEALIFVDTTLRYAELDARANQLAWTLRTYGVRPESRVAVCFEPGPEAIIALLAVLKAGGAYVPLDPSAPAERLALMLRDAQVKLLLTQEALRARLPEGPWRAVCVDSALETLSLERTTAPPRLGGPDNLAYVVYTSGSTGEPKGVMVAHRSVVNHNAVVARRFALGPGDRMLQFTPLYFDAVVEEIFPPLATGGTLCIRGDLVAPAAFSELIERDRLTVLSLPPAYFHEWVSELGLTGRSLPRSLRLVLLGGEKIRPESYALWQRVGGAKVPWVNVYGPTEATVTSAMCVIDGTANLEEPILPIGGPIGNVRIYLLDGQGLPVPAGHPGELYIGGAGLARGYVGRPAETAEFFVPDPFAPAAGARMYRTRDVARRLPDGKLEFLGREDSQVKLRGFRIELGDVESALRKHPATRDAVVVLSQHGDEPRLAAYVAIDAEAVANVPSAMELRAFVKELLPDYMVPAAFVVLDALPLSPNGKIDKKALPAPDWLDPERLADYAAPRSAVEELLTGIWGEVLGVAQVGVHDDFFDLGGHSLTATQATSRIRSVFQVDVPLSVLFENPTVDGFARHLSSRGTSRRETMKTVPRDQPLPMSLGQESLWFIDQIEPTSPAYTIPMMLKFSGVFDPEAMRASFEALVWRHEGLRTTFDDAQGRLTQKVGPRVPWALPLVDLSGFDASERARRFSELSRAGSSQHMDLRRGPLFRTTLVRHSPEEHVVLMSLHHVIADGWSLGVLLRELRALYRGRTSGEPVELPPLPLQYADFAVWQRAWLNSESFPRCREYWRTKLSGAQPHLELPFDRPPPATPSYHRGKRVLMLEPELIEGLQRLSQKEGATPFMTLLTAFKALLFRYTGQADLVVGTDVATRDQGELQDVVGYLLNQLVLRTAVAPQDSFRSLLKRVRQTTLEAFEYQDLPFQELVKVWNPERVAYHHGPVQVKLIYQNFKLPEKDVSSLLSADSDEVESHATPFLLAFVFDRLGEELKLTINFHTDRFDGETIDRLASHFLNVLRAGVTAPQTAVASLPLLSPDEREQALFTFNQTQQRFGDAQLVHDKVLEQARRTPDAIAVRCGEDTLTYARLRERATRLALELQAKGVGPERCVGLVLSPSTDSIACALGVLLAGGAYLALDPAAPSERIARILADSGSQVVIAHREHQGSLGVMTVPVLTPGPGFWESLPAASEGQLVRSVQSGNLAYVVYTSGSTGEPKGVLVQHRSVVNHNEAVARAFELGPRDRVLQFSPLHFDAAVEEIFPALGTGGMLVVREDLVSPGEFNDLIDSDGLTVLSLPPAFLHEWVTQLTREGSAVPAGLRMVLLGGEKIRPESLALWRARGGAHVPWVNVYGPTECTVTSAFCRISTNSNAFTQAMLPIGTPIANAQIYLLDKNFEPVPLRVTGELFISGEGVSRGFLGRPAETAERFLPNPFAATPGQRMYRTGDLGRRHLDGTLEFSGRADRQLKLRGFRIELGEIESALRSHPQVQDAVVTAVTDAHQQKRLVAYFVPLETPGPLPRDLEAHIAKSLPDYMVPSAFVPLEALPLTSTGKVDFSALPPLEVSAPREVLAPRTLFELKIAQLFEEVLGITGVGVEQSFFELGGHSLLALRLMDRITEELGVEVALQVLFDAPTVEAVAAAAELGSPPVGATPRVALATHATGTPLFIVHSAFGLATEYYALAQRLSADRPVYGLQASGLRPGETPSSSVEDMARAYVAAMREVQPHGPYLLAGYSIGGTIAFEMARQLERAGEAVPMLVLLDTWGRSLQQTVDAASPGKTVRNAEEALRVMARRFDIVLAPGPDRDHWTEVMDGLKARGIFPPGLTSDDLRRHASLYVACIQADARYLPGDYAGELVVVRTDASSEYGDPSLGWGSVVPGRIALHLVPGTHQQLLQPPTLDAVARILVSAAAKAQASPTLPLPSAAGPQVGPTASSADT